MKKATLFFIFITTPLLLFATQITGRICDGTTNKPLDFVNVTLYKKGSTTPLLGGFSDTNGKFELKADEGQYTFTATFVGYTTFSKDISIKKDGANVRLGTITLNEEVNKISEVEVVGQKSGMQLDIDKRVFNVDRSIVTEGATAAEILENIPSVEIDLEGNVSLRNSSSVEIWINGKPSGLSDTDKGQILEMLPASAIKSVEVITNPSAKYNPEGNAGIINIIMKEGSTVGYFGNVTAGINYRESSPYPGGQAGLNFNYSTKKWDLNLNTNIRYNRNDRSSELYRSDFATVDTTYLEQKTSSSMDRLNGFFRFGFTYHITQSDDLGFTTFGMVGNNWNKKRIDYGEYDIQKHPTLFRDRNTNSTIFMAFYNVGLSYKHSFIKDIHYISADAYFTGNNRNNESHYSTNAYTPDLKPDPDYAVREIQTLQNPAYRASGQVDYMNKLSKNHKIEAGLKADINISDSQDHTYDSIPGTKSVEEDMEKYNPFYYSEQIYAAYINYGGKFNWFSLQVGVRGEETITYTKSKRDNFYRSYFQPFPSVYLGFEIDNTNTLQLNYTRRINRPRGRMLNNYVDRSDPANIFQGNPYLMPEFGNALELNYLKNWSEHTLSVQLFYRYTENVIQRVSKLDVSTGVMYNTFENITYSQNAGIELVAKDRLFNNYLDLSTTISAYYRQLGANKEYDIKETNSFSWSARINANVKIINSLSAQVNAYYKSPEIIAQGSMDHQYGLDLGLKATFLKKKLSLSFSVRDVLNSRQNTNRITESSTFYQKNKTTSCGRNYRLTLTYTFGNLNNKNKTKNKQNNSENEFLDEEF